MSTSFCFELIRQEDRVFSYTIALLLAVSVICSLWFAILTMYKFYIPQQMPKVLKVGSIASTTALTLCQFFNVAVWICKYMCYPFGYYTLSPIYTVLYAIGYMSLLLMFSIKVHSSTKDSIYRLSNIFICFLTILGITFTILTVLIIVLLNTNQETLAHICIGLAFIVNLISYLVLLFKLLSTLFYVFKATIILSNGNFTSSDEWISIFNQIFEFKNDNINIDSTHLTVHQKRATFKTGSNSNDNSNNNNNHSNCTNNNTNNLNISMIKALGITRVMIRITVCVSIVFTSNIIVLIVLIFVHVLSLYQNGSMTTLLYLCYSIDLMVNNICLLYQYQFAQESYDKHCKLCNKFLKHIIFCRIETKMRSNHNKHVCTK